MNTKKYQKIYRTKNKNKIIKRQKEWYLKNRDKIIKRQKEWYLKNRDKVLLKSAIYTNKNRELINLKRKKYPSYGKYRNMEEYKEKQSVRRKVRYAIAKGTLKRLPCIVCQNPRSEGHHEDYTKPLHITWLCKKHHCEMHNKN